MEPDTINLIMQLLLHKDDLIVKTTLNLPCSNVQKNRP